jgi:DNA-binding CsgD family transcriptional regulator
VNRDTLLRFAYEVAANPQKRGDFVATFSEVIDAKAAAVAVEDRQLRWANLPITHGMDPSTIQSYCQYYVGLNPWAGRRPSTVGEVRSSDELLSEAEFRDTEFYYGWMRPRNWLYASSIIVHTTETERAYLFAVRPPNHPFTEGEIALYKDLAPHLATAAQIGKTLADLKSTINRLRSGALEMDMIAGLGLTPAESRITLALFNRQTPKECAYSAGLTDNTVRWHVRNIYKKLGVRRQADLIRLLGDLFRH